MSAARNLDNLKSWKPGQSGNPAGGTKLPEELRLIKSLSYLEASKIISKYARMPQGELRALVDDKNLSTVDRSVVSLFIKTIDKGDWQTLSFLFDRSIGKVREIEIDEKQAIREELQGLSTMEILRIVKANLPENLD